jgi:hypothetical protein
MSKTNIKQFQEQQFLLKIQIKKELETNVSLSIIAENPPFGNKRPGTEGRQQQRRRNEIQERCHLES